MRLVSFVLDRIYPPTCLACRAAVDEAGTLCPTCWRAMPFIEQPYCERLGLPFAQELGPGLISPAAEVNPPVFARARAVARYDGPARKLAQRLKYNDRLDLAPAMGRWMARAGTEILSEADLITPVPLHRVRLWRRRFNQAAVLAGHVARHARLPCETGLIERIKATRPQVGLTREERASNLQGAFRLTPEAAGLAVGRRIVLIDDVLTTGATLNACARALLKAGAARVDALTFARVVSGA